MVGLELERWSHPGSERRSSACPASPLTSLGASQKQVAERDGVGEDGDLPAEHQWLPQPVKPGGQQPADCGGPSLEHHGDDGDAQMLTRLKETQMEGQLKSQPQA